MGGEPDIFHFINSLSLSLKSLAPKLRSDVILMLLNTLRNIQYIKFRARVRLKCRTSQFFTMQFIQSETLISFSENTTMRYSLLYDKEDET